MDESARDAGASLDAPQPCVADLAADDLRTGRDAVQVGVFRVVRRHDSRHVRAVASGVNHNAERVAFVVDVHRVVARVRGAEGGVLLLRGKVGERLKVGERRLRLALA